MKFFNRDYLVVYALFTLSFLTRAFYVNVDSPFVFHPDEKTIVSSADSLRYDLNPKHFDWPTLTYYLNYFLYRVIEFIDSKILAKFNLNFFTTDFFYYYLTTRIVTSFMSSLGVVFMYLTILNFFKNQQLSILSATIFSLMPFYLFRSAQALPDIPMVFFGIVFLYFISLHYRNPKIRYLILSSIFLGFSVSSKYTGYLFGVTLVLYILLFSPNLITRLRNLIVSCICVVLGFLIGTPYALIDYKTFLISDSPKGALWQFSNVGKSDFFEQLFLFFKNLLLNDLGNYGFLPQVITIVFLIYLALQKFYYRSKIEIGLDTKLFLIILIQYFYIFWTVSGISENSQRAQHFLPVYVFMIVILTSFFVKFTSLRLKVLFIFLFVVLNVPSYLERIEESPIVKMSKTLQNVGNPWDIKVAYNYSDYRIVLQKLGYRIDKFDERNIKISKDVKYIFSSVELCKTENFCEYRQISREVNFFNQEKVFLYEKK